jgi:hypothetical protein
MQSSSFLKLHQPVETGGLAPVTNVRVMAAEEPFPTVAGMVEDLVCVHILRLVVIRVFIPVQCLCSALLAGKKEGQERIFFTTAHS